MDFEIASNTTLIEGNQNWMKAEQKKKLEEQLRKLMAQAEEPPEDKRPAPIKTGTVRVIRRRRGQPDMLIA